MPTTESNQLHSQNSHKPDDGMVDAGTTRLRPNMGRVWETTHWRTREQHGTPGGTVQVLLLPTILWHTMLTQYCSCIDVALSMMAK